MSIPILGYRWNKYGDGFKSNLNGSMKVMELG